MFNTLNPWEAFDSSKISDFGTLSNASDEDKIANKLFLLGHQPLALVSDKYKKIEELKKMLANLELYIGALEATTAQMDMKINYSSLLAEVQKFDSFFEVLREIAVVYSAHGTFAKPNHLEFRNLMRKVLSRALSGLLDGNNKVRNKLEADLKSAKDDGERNWGWYREECEVSTKAKAESSKAKEDLQKLKQTHTKVVADLALINQQNKAQERAIIQAIDAIEDLEEENQELQTKIIHNEEVSLEVINQVIAVEDQNEKLQENQARLQKEKDETRNRFDKGMSDLVLVAEQRHTQSLTKVAELRKELSPLRRELFPLRRQLAEQEEEIKQKDSKIQQLTQALVNVQLQKKKQSPRYKKQRTLQALQKMRKKNDSI